MSQSAKFVFSFGTCLGLSVLAGLFAFRFFGQAANTIDKPVNQSGAKGTLVSRPAEKANDEKETENDTNGHHTWGEICRLTQQFNKDHVCADYRLSIAGVWIGRVYITRRSGLELTKPGVAVRMSVENLSDRKRLTYWPPRSISMRDDVGNGIGWRDPQARIEHWISDSWAKEKTFRLVYPPRVDGVTELLPGALISDAFVFDLPLPKTKHLIMEIGAGMVTGPECFSDEYKWVFPMNKLFVSGNDRWLLTPGIWRASSNLDAP
jgi:hypothetical protein